MSVKHLSDNQIQSYIDNKNDSIHIEAHLANCEKCSAIMAEYKMLFDAIPKAAESKLSSGFAKSVMKEINQVAPAEESSWFMMISACTLGIIITIASLGYIVGYNAILQYLKSIRLDALIPQMEVFNVLRGFVERFDSVLGIGLFAGMVIVFFLLLDKMLLSQKSSRLSSFSI